MSKDKTISLKEQLNAFTFNGQILDSDGVEDSCYNFYDWFCNDKSLKRKATKLFNAVKTFVKKFDIDTESTYCFFENNYPLSGPLYDDFRICDRKTGDVIYTVSPKSGHTGNAEIWSRENDFEGPLYEAANLTELYKTVKQQKEANKNQAQEILDFLLKDNTITEDDIKRAKENC